MRNISFDNPYLLLALIPLLLLIIIPFAIAIRKSNRSKSSTASLILHVLMSVCIVLALAGVMVTTVMTETQVYVVADISYSADRNLDQVDELVRGVEANLPRNAQMGVVCFGKDQTVLTEPGMEFTGVRNATVDVGATDISGALNFTADLFKEGVVKRIVLITDGKDTDPAAAGHLVAAVENLYAQNIHLDVIYVDNNLTEEDREVQISDVEFTPSTFLDHETTADVLVRANQNTRATVMLYRNGTQIQSLAVDLTTGFNIVNFDLPTNQVGTSDYRVIVSCGDDVSTFNNTYSFTQSVTGRLNVLLVSSKTEDMAKAKSLYGDTADVTAYIHDESFLRQIRLGNITDTAFLTDMPCSVEELCLYDEILLSDIDIRDPDNYTSFVDSVDKVVSLFGKSLVTMGDLKIQNKTDDVLTRLEDMLPVRFGNNDQDPKLYAIVLDTSRSMENFSRLWIAKQAAVQLLGLLSDDDHVMVVNFWGEINVLQAPVKASNRNEIARLINAIQPYQGTMMGTALDKAGEMMKGLPYEDMQIMLISDGASYSMESDTPADIVEDLREYGIITSVIHPAPLQPTDGSADPGTITLNRIVEVGGGSYYPVRTMEDMEALMFSDIADELTESVVEKQTAVNVVRRDDAVLTGISALPDIMGYVHAKAKASATTVLTVDYVKASGKIIDVPLYAYWRYGDGRVASFTGALSGPWTSTWEGNAGDAFLDNVVTVNTPAQRIDRPYTLDVTYDGTTARVEMTPVTLDPYATAEMDVVLPGGARIKDQTMNFDGSHYTFGFDTPTLGKYKLEITYTYDQGTKTFTSETVFNICYPPEYDSFAVFDPSPLHAAVRNRGTISEGTVPPLDNDDREVATYTLRFTVPLMIAAVVLYVVDIIIRKLKMADIRSFFKIKPGKGGAR